MIEYNGLMVFLDTKDLEKTDKFYTNILGLNLYKDDKSYKIYEIPGGGKIGFCENEQLSKEQNNIMLTLITDNVDELYEVFIANGYENIEKPIENKKFKIYNFFVNDPNGYRIEIRKILN